MLRKLLLAATVLLLCDLSFAQVAKILRPLNWHQAFELKYRVKSDIYHHDLRPNMDVKGVWRDEKYPVHTNSLGFKDRAVRQVPLDSENWRLLFMGDSFTEGTGVEYDATFVGLIDRELGEAGIEVLNGAVMSYSPSIYHRKVKYLIEDVGLDFDELVVFIDISDIDDEVRFYDSDAHGNIVPPPATEEARPRRLSPRTWLKQNSLTLRTLEVFQDRYLLDMTLWGSSPFVDEEALMRRTKPPARSGWTLNEQQFERIGRRGLEQSGAAMDALLELLSLHGKPLTIAVYPWPVQVMAGDLESKQVKFWRAWAAPREVTLINLFPVFVNDQDPWEVLRANFIRWDHHLNPTGHRLVAERFLQHFHEKGG